MTLLSTLNVFHTLFQCFHWIRTGKYLLGYSNLRSSEWWWWWIVLRNGWSMKSVKPYFQPEPLSEILNIANHRHAVSRIWNCGEPELRLCWMKLCCSDNHYITVLRKKKLLWKLFWMSWIKVKTFDKKVWIKTCYFHVENYRVLENYSIPENSVS